MDVSPLWPDTKDVFQLKALTKWTVVLNKQLKYKYVNHAITPKILNHSFLMPKRIYPLR